VVAGSQRRLPTPQAAGQDRLGQAGLLGRGTSTRRTSCAGYTWPGRVAAGGAEAGRDDDHTMG